MPPDPIPPGTDLVQPFRRSPLKTLALMAALAEGAQAASLAWATHLAAQLGIQGLSGPGPGGGWAPGPREPWWRATDLTDPLADLFRTPPYLPSFPPGTRTGPRLSRLPGGIAFLRKRARLVRRRARVLQQHLPRPQLPASSPGDKPLTSPHESEKRSASQGLEPIRETS